MNILFGLTLLGLLLFPVVSPGVSTQQLLDTQQYQQPAAPRRHDRILAVGQTFVIITAGIDLSVGAVVGFTSVIVAWLLQGGRSPVGGNRHHFVDRRRHWYLSWLRHRAHGPAGLHHYVGDAHLSLRGIGLLLTNGSTISISNEAFTNFSRADFSCAKPVLDGDRGGDPRLHLPAHEPLGPLSLRCRFQQRSGPPLRRQRQPHHLPGLYSLLHLRRLRWPAARFAYRHRNATQAEGWELQAIASSVIGGTSLFGAVGSVHGPLLGAFILATINNGANLLNVNSFWQRIITGALIIIIVYFDQLRRRGTR